MFNYLNPKYYNSEELAKYQDFVIDYTNKVVDYDRPKILKLIKELNNYNILFKSFFGLNSIPKSNLYIRQNLILSGMHLLLGEDDFISKYTKNANQTFKQLLFGDLYYAEGYSYFKYVNDAFDFYHTCDFKTSNSIGLLSSNSYISEIYQWIQKIKSSYDKLYSNTYSIPVNETWRSEWHLPTDYADVTGKQTKRWDEFKDDSYHRFKNKNTYILRTLHKNYLKYPNNLHVNNDYDHVVIQHNDVWLLRHNWYNGFKEKIKTYEPYEHNMNFPVSLKHERELIVDKAGKFVTIKDSTPNMMDLPNVLQISGEIFSIYHLDKNCKFEVLEGKHQLTKLKNENILKVYGQYRSVKIILE